MGAACSSSAKTPDNYAALRLQLIDSGWLPLITHLVMPDGTLERDFGDARIMKDAGFEEVEFCTGVDLNYCTFNFYKSGECLRVTTLGEYSATDGSPRVSKIERPDSQMVINKRAL